MGIYCANIYRILEERKKVFKFSKDIVSRHMLEPTRGEDV